MCIRDRSATNDGKGTLEKARAREIKMARDWRRVIVENVRESAFRASLGINVCVQYERATDTDVLDWTARYRMLIQQYYLLDWAAIFRERNEKEKHICHYFHYINTRSKLNGRELRYMNGRIMTEKLLHTTSWTQIKYSYILLIHTRYAFSRMNPAANG